MGDTGFEPVTYGYIRVQRLLGHADLQMATRYVQDVSKQTDRVVENSSTVCNSGKNLNLL
jgi:integrase